MEHEEAAARRMETADSSFNSSPTKMKNKRKGGFRACIFIFVLEVLGNMAFVANMLTLVLYFYLVMHFDLPSSANTLTNFMGSTYLLSVIGGFISDTYLSRLNTALIFGSFEVLAFMMITIQSYKKDLQPEDCGKSSCVEGGIAIMFYTSLGLLALGTGGVRGCVPSLGGDQFDQKNPKEAKAMASFFNWLFLSISAGAIAGVVGVVYVFTEKGWCWGFFISTLAVFLGLLVLACGKPFYRLRPPAPSPLTRTLQVIVVAIKNRRLTLPAKSDELYEEERDLGQERILHTDQFRCLDRAAIIRDNCNPVPWRICTVTQVEEVKILARMLPILFSTMLMNTCLAQLQTFSVQQGRLMDPRLGSIKIPTPSIPVFPLICMSILLLFYEFIFVPFARKITKHPSGITQLQRIGVGLVLSAISMAIAGIVEVKRRNEANKDPSNPKNKISLFWLLFQYGVFAIADMFAMVGLLEFFYKEAPAGMRSLSTSFTWLSLSFGYFLSSVFVSIINTVTKRMSPSKNGWIHETDLNKSRVDLFYWFLAILSGLNFAVYLYFASWYKYKPEDRDPDIAKGLKPRASSNSLVIVEDVNEDDQRTVKGKEISIDEAMEMHNK